jgi:hypothetical protein
VRAGPIVVTLELRQRRAGSGHMLVVSGGGQPDSRGKPVRRVGGSGWAVVGAGSDAAGGHPRTSDGRASARSTQQRASAWLNFAAQGPSARRRPSQLTPARVTSFPVAARATSVRHETSRREEKAMRAQVTPSLLLFRDRTDLTTRAYPQSRHRRARRCRQDLTH